MMKFFRKYNKQLLAVFMALLLVVWLAGSALTALLTPDYSKTVLAQTRHGDLTEGDRRAGEHETNMLQTIGLPWTNPAGSTAVMSGQAEPLNVFDWVLLTREAEHMGMTARPEEATSFLNAQGMTLDRVNLLAQRLDVTPESLYGAVAQFLSVLKAAEVVSQSAQMSEAEIRVAARNTNERVRVDLVSLPASAFEDAGASFTDEQIEAHFAKYKEQRRGEGLTFGYYLEPRVKVQYVKVDLEKVIAGLRVPEATLERRARDFWRENKDSPEFLRPRDEATSQPTTSSAPATQPSRFYETFAEAHEKAISNVRRQMALDQATKLADYLLRRAAEPWFEAEPAEDGFKKRPAGAEDPKLYETILRDIPPELQYEGAVTTAATDWFTQEQAAAAPEIGQARLITPGKSALGLDRLAFQVEGLISVPDEAAGGSDVDRSLYLARFESSAVALRDDVQNFFVFRVIDVQPGRAPTGVDEVRDLVIADLRLQKAYEAAQAEAEKLLSSTREAYQACEAQDSSCASLQTAWNGNTELQEKIVDKGGVSKARSFARQMAAFRGFKLPVNVPGLGQVGDEFVDRCFALGDPKSGGEKWAVIPLPEKATMAVVEWQEITPMVVQNYSRLRGQVVQQTQFFRQQGALAEWFDPVLIRSRNGLEFRQ